MSCTRGALENYLTNFTGSDPIDAVVCAYASGAGLGVGETVFALFVFASIGFGLTVRVRHPAPIVVASMLSIGVVASSIPAGAMQIVALEIFFVLVGAGLILYQRAQSSL